MSELLKKLVFPFRNPSSNFNVFLNSANFGLLFLTITVFGIGGYFTPLDFHPILSGIGFGIVGFLIYVIVFQLLNLLTKLSRKFPQVFFTILFCGAISLYLAKNIAFRWPVRPYLIGGIISTVLVAILAGILGLFFQTKKKSTLVYIGVSLFLIVLSIFWLAGEGQDNEHRNQVSFFNLQVDQFAGKEIASPLEKGDYSVKNLTYGSGNDYRRKEYSSEIDFISNPVDATLILPEWKGKKKKWREKYWKFGIDSLPLNGRISMPSEKGRYPLVLFVHGNHGMTDYSDEGYKYLTELLASKGYISISVDENFLNGHWSGDFRGKEMPARAWILLKHIEQLKTWNEDPSHELKGRIDLDRIMLVGHSRGGEAVAISAAFNNLGHFPDNALEEFSFDFGIKSVVSIAPTDYRYERKINLKNVNYLSIQGSYDSDESSFWGFRAYQRLKFDDGKDWIKAAIYVDRANHGQFNSTWNRSDMGAPMSWLMNLKPILDRSAQEQTAKTTITAFAEITLKNKSEYLPFFKNPRSAQSWLPDNILISNLQSSNFYPVANFEEDMDPSTSTSGGGIDAENFSYWQEVQLRTRDGELQDNNAVLLGWNYGEEMERDSIAKYTITALDSFAEDVKEMVISIAAGDPKMLSLENKILKDSLIDFTLYLKDEEDQSYSININEVKPISPRITVKFGKEKSINDRFGREWEVQLESFHIPVSKFENEINIRKLKEIRLVFDQVNYGMVYIDDIGWQ